MSNYVNKIITKDKEKYNINDSRIPSPTPEDKGKVLGVNRKGELDFIKLGTGSGDAIGLVEGTITEFEAADPLQTIRPYMFNELTDLVNINLNGVIKDVGQNAINHCDNLGVLNLGKIDGVVGDYAFSNLIKVSEFSLDPESNITDLGRDCFAGLGMERNSAERFYIDLRNSTFTNFQGFGTATVEASYASGTDEIVREAIPGVGLFNTEVRLPNTVETLMEKAISSGNSGWAMMSGSGGILNSSENVDVYFTGKDKQIVLNSVDMLPTDEQSHIYIPFDIYGTYKISTNWAALDNLYGYFEEGEIPSGQLLPTWDNEGFEVNWYSDKNLQNKITKSNGQEIYACETGLRLFSKVILFQSNDASITIEDDTGHLYESGELIRVGTRIKIKAVPNTLEDELTLFLVNDQDYTEAAEANFTLTEANTYVSVICNVYNMPSYLRADRTYDYNLNKETYAIYGNGSYNMPSEVFINNKYLSNRKFIEAEVFSTIKQYQWEWGGNYSITKVGLGEGFKLLSYGAFSGCYQLSSINLPNSLEYISDWAFGDCYGLTTLTGTEGVKYIAANAFSHASSLTEVSFPKVSYIGNGAFAYCSSLQEVSFPEVTNIRNNAFAYCYNLTSISFPLCVSIADYAFQSCSNLSSLYLPEVTTIRSYAFAGCSLSGTLNNEILPNIASLAGFPNTGINEVSFSTVTTLGTCAFENCYNLTTVNLPNCTLLQSSALAYCYNLSNLNIPHLQRISGRALRGCALLSELEFKELNCVDQYGFGEVPNLQTISLPSCTILGTQAFEYCSSLKNVYVPICTEVESQAFQYCSEIESLSFPKCEHINGVQTFYNCSKLQSLYILTSKVPTLKEDDLYGLTAFDCTPILDSSILGYYGSIYVKASLVQTFKTAKNWDVIADRIVGLTDVEINNL